MRGQSLKEGLAFSPSPRTKFFGASPHAVPLMAAPEYAGRNVRNSSMIYRVLAKAMGVKHKPAYGHVQRYWSHVPSTPPEIIERRQKRERLKEAVKREC